MAWDPYTAPFDSPLFNGIVALGEISITKLERKYRLMKIEPFGARGALIRHLGQYLLESTIVFRLFDQDQYRFFNETIKPMLTKIPSPADVRAGKKYQAVRITHPSYLAYEVESMVVEAIRGPLQEGDIWIAEVDVCEYTPIPRASFAKPTDAPKPVDNDPFNQEIARLTNQIVKRLNE